MLNATGCVGKLRENSYFQRILMSSIELNKLLLERTINVRLLQKILEFSDDEQLSQYFYETIGRNNFFDVIISRDEIATLRKLCYDYEHQLNQLYDFYNEFCSASKVTDVNEYVQDIQKRIKNSDRVKLKEVLMPDYWAFHGKALDNARNFYKLNESQTFRTIFKANLEEDADAQKLVLNTIEKYNSIQIFKE